MKWPSRNQIVSAISGGFGTICLVLAFRDTGSSGIHFPFLKLGLAAMGISTALDPNILFQKISIQIIRTGGFTTYGVSAWLEIIARICFVMAGFFWLAERMF